MVIQHQAELQITVHDDGGGGFDPDSRHAGFGLTGLRERLGLIDGELHITSSPQGTTIHASIPTGHRLAQTA